MPTQMSTTIPGVIFVNFMAQGHLWSNTEHPILAHIFCFAALSVTAVLLVFAASEDGNDRAYWYTQEQYDRHYDGVKKLSRRFQKDAEAGLTRNWWGRALNGAWCLAGYEEILKLYDASWLDEEAKKRAYAVAAAERNQISVVTIYAIACCAFLAVFATITVYPLFI